MIEQESNTSLNNNALINVDNEHSFELMGSPPSSPNNNNGFGKFGNINCVKIPEGLGCRTRDVKLQRELYIIILNISI